MERKSLMSESLKDHSIGSQHNFNTTQHQHLHPHKPNMFKGTWIAATAAYQTYGDHHHHPTRHDYIDGSLSWPPRSYSCNFCKREFRSAQALGGHMNVHRRDRARLRQLSPTPASTTPASTDGQYSFLSLNPGNATSILNPSPNPNPNLPCSSPSLFVPTRPQVPLDAISTSSAPQIHLDAHMLSSRFGPTNETKAVNGDFLDGWGSRVKDIRPWMNNKGLIKLGMEVEVVKEDLDLELRLGCP